MGQSKMPITKKIKMKLPSPLNQLILSIMQPNLCWVHYGDLGDTTNIMGKGETIP